jgi:hypothetical protein
MSRIKAAEERLDKLEIALLMLLNSLRDTQTIEDISVLKEIPGSMLDIIEKIIVNRVSVKD